MSTPASPTDWQSQINRALGLADPDAVTVVIWDLHSDKYQFDDYSLQAAYTTRDRAKPILAAITGGMGGTANRDYTEGVTAYKDNQLWQQVHTAYEDALKEIDTRIQDLVANRSGAIGQMVTTAPNDPPVGTFDPNDSVFRGDPSRRFGPYPWGNY